MTSFRDKIKEQKEQMVKDQKKDAEQSSGGFSSIVIRDKIPQGIPEYRPGGGTHLIDAIPFYTGEDFPDGKGLLKWCLRIWDHTRIGAMNEAFICLAHTWKLLCPVEELKMTGVRLPDEEYNKVKAKLRNILLVWSRDNEQEEAKGVQWWYISHFFFGAHIDKICKNPKGGGIIDFWDPDNGKSIAFDLEIKGENQEWSGHRFVDRDAPIPDRILNQSFSLDSVIKWKPTYEEFYEAFHGEKFNPDKPKETTLSRLRKPEDETPKETYGPETTGTGKFCGECGKPQYRTPSGITCENGHGGTAEQKPVQDKKPEEHPIKAEDPGKKEKEEVKATGTSTTCGRGFTFGTDCDKKDCAGCPQWDDCSDEAARILTAGKTTQTAGKKRLLA